MSRATIGRPLELATVIKHLVLAPVALIFAVPFLWVIITSFKSPSEYYDGGLLPRGAWQFSNYTHAIVDYRLFHYYANSTLMSVGSVVLGMVLSLMVAYALFRLRFRFRNVMFVSLVVLMMLPPQLTLISQFLLFQKTGILYTPLALILPIRSGCCRSACSSSAASSTNCRSISTMPRAWTGRPTSRSSSWSWCHCRCR